MVIYPTFHFSVNLPYSSFFTHNECLRLEISRFLMEKSRPKTLKARTLKHTLSKQNGPKRKLLYQDSKYSKKPTFVSSLVSAHSFGNSTLDYYGNRETRLFIIFGHKIKLHHPGEYFVIPKLMGHQTGGQGPCNILLLFFYNLAF